MVLVLESPANGDGGVERERRQYLCPSCLAERSSSKAIFPARWRNALMSSIALSISACRRRASGTIRAMVRPRRVITTVSPRATSRRLTSAAPESFRTSVHFSCAVHDKLRQIAFEERKSIIHLINEGLDHVLTACHYATMAELSGKKR
jgi:hypothetical protein